MKPTHVITWPKAGRTTGGLRILAFTYSVKNTTAKGGIILYRPSTGKLRAVAWQAHQGPHGEWISHRRSDEDSTRCCRHGRPVFSRKKGENSGVSKFISKQLKKLSTKVH
jgi:hypothetical protein